MTDQSVIDRPQDSAPVEREISFESAKEEPVSAEVEPEQSEEKEDVVDVLVPKTEPRVWHFGPNNELEFVQRPLSFLGKMQWFSLVGEVMDQALSGENKMSLNSLFDTPGRAGALSIADFRDADMFVQAVGKLLVHAPKFLTDSYCIWLNVPDFQRDLVVNQIWNLPADQGGLSDDDGIEIIEVFIDQNYEALDAFFREKIAKIQRRAQKRAEAVTLSRRSRR
jgi:hypothetical protein